MLFTRGERATQWFGPHMVDDAAEEACTPLLTLDDYEIGATLGLGALGVCQLVKHRNAGQVLVLKTMLKAHVVRLGQAERVNEELEIAAAVRHPFLGRLVAAAHDASHLYLLSEALLGGELAERLVECERLDEPEAAFNLGCVVSALTHLHERNIVYRDLKPENLVFDGRGYLKLIDFGLAKAIGDSHTLTLCGTPDYMSPEVLHGGGYGFSVDWWALGVLLHEMLRGDTPFSPEEDEKEGGAAANASRPDLSCSLTATLRPTLADPSLFLVSRPPFIALWLFTPRESPSPSPLQ